MWYAKICWLARCSSVRVLGRDKKILQHRFELVVLAVLDSVSLTNPVTLHKEKQQQLAKGYNKWHGVGFSLTRAASAGSLRNTTAIFSIPTRSDPDGPYHSVDPPGGVDPLQLWKKPKGPLRGTKTPTQRS